MTKNYYIEIESPVGTLVLVSNGTAITHLLWSSSAEGKILKKTCVRKSTGLLKKASLQLNQYFRGTRTKFDLPLEPSGTEFQQKAWIALSKIPYGEVWSYKEQARRVGSPLAMRAVGTSNAKNPIAIIVPCHRVLASNGALAGYGGGLDKKRILLELEGHKF